MERSTQRRAWWRRVLPAVLLGTLLLALVIPAATVDARPGGGSRSSVSRSSGGSSSGSSGSSRSSSGSSGGGVIVVPGGGYSSGGSSYSSGGGGGSAVGTIIFLLVILLIVLIIFAGVRNHHRSQQYRSQQFVPEGGMPMGDGRYSVPVDALPGPSRGEEIGRWKQDDARIAAALAEIKQRDPAFDESHFKDRVETAYTILNQAWVHGDLTPALPFLGEGEANRLTAQLQGDRDAHRRNVMSDMVINGTRIVQVDRNDKDDILICRIDASAADWYEDTRTGQVIDGWKNPRPYTEYWTFARSGTAKTTKTSYLSRTCPNCGAPLELGNISVCQYCGTPIASTEYDWVLVNIEQKYTND